MGADWVVEMLLPLWDTPGGDAAGWLAGGWRVPEIGEPRPLSTAAMVETGYAVASFVVGKLGPDGWFELRWSIEDSATPHSGWSHTGHLAMGAEPLIVEPWEAYLRQEVHFGFRQESVPHTLRAAPSADAAAITRIGARHELELLEIDGDWMRVRVLQPPKRCRNPGTWKGVEHSGWIRWRSLEKGPWVWPFTRGC
jgi:hypothetical protein